MQRRASRSQLLVFVALSLIVVALDLQTAALRFLHTTGSRRGLLGAGLLATITPKAAKAGEPQYAVFKVDLNGDEGGKDEIKVLLRPDWAPKGVKHFKKLVSAGYMEDTAVYHVTAEKARFGLPNEPTLEPPSIQDEIRRVSNKRGTLAFVQDVPNSRSLEMFFNRMDNERYDKMEYVPIGEVIDEDMEVLDKFYDGYRASPNVEIIEAQGDKYLDEKFPKISTIEDVVLS